MKRTPGHVSGYPAPPRTKEPVLGRRAQRKNAIRAELVRAGRKLFSQEGIYEASVEDLAEQAGIAKGTLYLYFGNKQALACAVLETGFRELEQTLTDATAACDTFAELVDEITRVHVEFFAANPDLLRIFHQARGILKFLRPDWVGLRRPLEQHVRLLTLLLARVPSPVRERPAQRRAIALALFGAISGACSVRAAVESGPGAAPWSSLLRAGLTSLATELARRNGPGHPGRTRGRA